MSLSEFKLSSFAQSLGVCLVALTVLSVMLPQDFELSRKLVDNAPYVLLAIFGVGFLSFLFNKKRLMLGSFLGTAILAMFLKTSVATVSPQLPIAIDPLKEEHFKVVQFSTVNLAVSKEEHLNSIVKANGDLIAINGLTPVWSSTLKNKLSETHPYQYLYQDIGVHGIGLFSKIPFDYVDTFHINNIVHIDACSGGIYNSHDLNVMAIQTMPPVNNESYHILKSQLKNLSERIKQNDRPYIVLGDFNSVPWSDEIYKFLFDANLNDSRRNMQSTFVKGSPQFFEVPVEHIFYSKALDCLKYRSLRNNGLYIGNGATFRENESETQVAAL